MTKRWIMVLCLCLIGCVTVPSRTEMLNRQLGIMTIAQAISQFGPPAYERQDSATGEIILS